MTDLRREAPPRQTPSVPRETPQRPPNRFQRRLAAAGLATAVLIAGAASGVVLGAGSARPPVHRGATTTTGHTSRPRTSRTTSTPRRTGAAPSRPAPTALTAVSTYWDAIERQDFAAAYAILAPGAVPQTEAEWASTEQSTRIESVRFNGEVGDSSSTAAAITVVSLVTVDQRFGCRSWTGTYRMTRLAGHWLIARADITPHPCTTG